MKKRIAFLGAILSLMPITQSLIIKKSVVLSTAGFILSIQKNVKAESGDFYFERGITKAEKGNYKGSIKDFTKAIEINPKDGVAYFLRGLSKNYLKLYEDAINDFNSAIAIIPDDPNFFYERGVSKFNLNLYQEAVEDFTKAIKINPDISQYYFSRGAAKNMLNDDSDCSDAKKSISLGYKDALNIKWVRRNCSKMRL